MPAKEVMYLYVRACCEDAIMSFVHNLVADIGGIAFDAEGMAASQCRIAPCHFITNQALQERKR